MQYEIFEYARLVDAVERLEYAEEKVMYISNEMLRCKALAIDIRSDVRKLEFEPIAITTKNAEINKMILEALQNDSQFNNEVIKEILNLIEEKICLPYNSFLLKADELKKHHENNIELELKLYQIRQNKNVNNLKGKNNNRIIWRVNEDKLITLFSTLYKEQLLPEYKKEEVLHHFVDERLRRFNFLDTPLDHFTWLESDSAFAVLVNELARRGAIIEKEKFKNFANHFLNNKGNKFKSLSQKRSYTDNTNNTGDFIRQILVKVGI